MCMLRGLHEYSPHCTLVTRPRVQTMKRLSVTNLSSENNLLMFRLNAPVAMRAKVMKCEKILLFIPMHY